MTRSVLLITILFSSTFATASSFQISSKSLLKKNLEVRRTSLDQWIQKLNSEGYDLVCFGETHNSYFRDFISTQVTSHVNANVLAIENRAEKAEALSSTPLPEGIKVAGENFTNVAGAFFSKNPHGEIVGVEATQEQKAKITFSQIDQLNGEIVDKEPSRDASIAENLDTVLQSQTQVFAVYGAKHCSYFNDGLGRDTPFVKQLESKYGETKTIITVHVILPEEENLIKTYLKEFELFDSDKTFVLFDVKNIDPEVYNHRLELFKLLKSYDVLVFPAD